jgi:hypothetical protein
MKGRVDKSRRIEPLMSEGLSKIKPTDPIRLVTRQLEGNETDQIPRAILQQNH